MDNIYMYKGKDVSLIFMMKITEVCKCISKETGIKFQNVAPSYYASNTYKAMVDTDNGLWLEPAGYIANQFLKEKQ